MIEAEKGPSHLWFTHQIRKVFMDSCGYAALTPMPDGEEVFARRLRDGIPFPRFHLIIAPNGRFDYKFDLHFDERPHITDYYGQNVPIELRRINTCLNEASHPDLDLYNFRRLKGKFMELMLYGAYESMLKPRLSRSMNIMYGSRKTTKRKMRSPRPALGFDIDEYYDL